MNVFTTINPNGNFEAQNEAMSSWASKFTIYSVNTKNDINKVKDLYPYIKFIETDDTFNFNISEFRNPPFANINKNKKLIKLNSILESIKKTKGQYFCIVNSDIILKTEKLNNLINNKYLSKGLIISTRYELEGDIVTRPFSSGYDIFIFDKKNIDILFNDNYVIGMPWWDYWVPIISLKYLILYHIDDQIFFHRTHDTNYNPEYWIKFGEHLYKDVVLDIIEEDINIDIFKFCTIIKKHIERKQININL
jgi:hypothetical protein